MLKPARYSGKWAVGDKFFTTYRKASAYITQRRRELQRETLIDEMDRAYRPGDDPNIEDMADAVLAKFKLTPRK